MSDFVLRVARTELFSTINLYAVDRDPRLSWKAVGLLVYLTSRPPDWDFFRGDIEQRHADGRDAVKSGLAELTKFDFLRRRRSKDATGAFDGWEWFVSEVPLNEIAWAQWMDAGIPPTAENPSVGKPVGRETRSYSSNHGSKRVSIETPTGQSGLFEEGEGVLLPSSNGKGWPAKPAKTNGRYVYPEEFDRAFALYPERAGGNPKLGAYRAARVLVRGGLALKILVDTAGNYATWSRKSRILGSRNVMQAKTFWGPDEPFRDFEDGMPKVDVEEKNGGGENPDEFVAREKERRRQLLEGSGR